MSGLSNLPVFQFAEKANCFDGVVFFCFSSAFITLIHLNNILTCNALNFFISFRFRGISKIMITIPTKIDGPIIKETIKVQ